MRKNEENKIEEVSVSVEKVYPLIPIPKPDLVFGCCTLLQSPSSHILLTFFQPPPFIQRHLGNALFYLQVI